MKQISVRHFGSMNGNVAEESVPNKNKFRTVISYAKITRGGAGRTNPSTGAVTREG